MINLSANPFFLDSESIDWVEKTIGAMTDSEKIWQLFADPLIGLNRQQILDYLSARPLGACSFRALNSTQKEARETLSLMQKQSKIPMLISADCGTGANGRLAGGTFVATAAQAGAAADSKKIAYDIGNVACKELGAVGYNWAFEPVGDLLLNWRNCLINTRAYSSDPDKVIECVDAFNQAADDNEFLSCLKHFPGDGWEERDQHIVAGNNGLTCEEWEDSFGKVYRHAISSGIKSIMIGHFTLPSWQRKLNPNLKDQDMDTACISEELINGLLRGILGYNGLVVTDQTMMIGFYTKTRREALPAAINAGCDMILGINDPDEDYKFIADAINQGKLSWQRIEDAVRRILAAKASIGLHVKHREGKMTPPIEALDMIGCDDHLRMSVKAADEAITLVKNSRNQLPIRPETHKRILLYALSSSSISNQFGAGVAGGGNDKLIESIKQIAETEGFEVTIWDENVFNSISGGIPGNAKGRTSDISRRFDAVFLFADLTKFASINSIRLEWPVPMASIAPWYVPELPVVFVSLNLTNHLIDVPRVPIFINAYNNKPETIKLVFKKIMGESEFKGKFEDTVWCGKWDTHL